MPRAASVAFHIARRVLEHYFEKDEYARKPWLFPDLLDICKRWVAGGVTCKDGTFKQLLLFVEHCQTAADKVYHSIVAADAGPKRLLPIPKPYDTIGSTRYVSFDTVKPTYKTDPDPPPRRHRDPLRQALRGQGPPPRHRPLHRGIPLAPSDHFRAGEEGPCREAQRGCPRRGCDHMRLAPGSPVVRAGLLEAGCRGRLP